MLGAVPSVSLNFWLHIMKLFVSSFFFCVMQKVRRNLCSSCGRILLYYRQHIHQRRGILKLPTFFQNAFHLNPCPWVRESFVEKGNKHDHPFRVTGTQNGDRSTELFGLSTLCSDHKDISQVNTACIGQSLYQVRVGFMSDSFPFL